jgi:hypothetical protein
MVPVEPRGARDRARDRHPHGRAAAVVVEKPLIDPKKKIPKRALGAALGGGSGSAADG